MHSRPSRVVVILALSLSVPSAAALAQENVMRPPAPPAASAKSPTPTPQFIAVDRIDFSALLPAPPAPDSLAAKVDLETVLQVQAWRTPEQVAWAKRVERDNVFYHADVLGAWFTAERLPVTAAFFRRLADDMRLLDGASKKPFLRPRPATVDSRVQPCVDLPSSTSYPSGSAMQAFVWAEFLSDVLPEQRAALFDRASRAAWGRVIGGVHFPSDVVAGRRLAEAYIAAARQHHAFAEAFAAVRAELSAAASSASAPR